MSEIDIKEYGALTERVKHLENELQEMRDDVKRLLAITEQAQGSWRVLMMVGGAGAAIASAVTWVVQHVKIG